MLNHLTMRARDPRVNKVILERQLYQVNMLLPGICVVTTLSFL